MIRQVVVVGWPTLEKRLSHGSLLNNADTGVVPIVIPIASGMIVAYTIGDDRGDLDPLQRPVLRPNTTYGTDHAEFEYASSMMIVRCGSSGDPVRLVDVRKKGGRLTVRCVRNLAREGEAPEAVLEYWQWPGPDPDANRHAEGK